MIPVFLFLTSLYITGCRFSHLTKTDSKFIIFYGWVNSPLIHVPYLHLFICRWTSTLLSRFFIDPLYQVKEVLFYSYFVSWFLVFLFFFFSFWPCCMACGILVPQTGIEYIPSAMKTWSLSHCTTREFPRKVFFFFF